MQCPKCGVGRLSPIKVGKVEADRCLACEGLWLDPDELEEILENYSEEVQKINLDNGALDGCELGGHKEYFDNKHGTCPVCDKEMEHREFNDITADFCKEGHGVWLDGGEISCLIKKMSYYDIVRYIFSIKGFKEILRNLKK